MRNSEAIADNWAAKHGLGDYLVTGLAKITNSRSITPSTSNAIIDSAAIAILTVVTAGLAPLIMLLLFNPTKHIYDSPRERYTRIRNAVVLKLKDKSRPREEQKAILDRLTTIDNEIAETNAFDRGVWDVIYETLIPTGRQQKKLRRLHQAIETMGANDLYVTSAKLDRLK